MIRFIALLLFTGADFNFALGAVSLDHLQLRGDALRRAELNLRNLQTATEYFDPDSTAFPATGWIAQWPGDTSGRLLLGLCRAYEVTGVKSPRIEQLLRNLPRYLNAAGYMGEMLPPGLMDEQYLAGNGWLIRALCAHHRLFGDAESKQLAARVLEGLLGPALQAFPCYPVGRDLHHDGKPGQVSEVGIVDGWRLTNDIGSGFMFIDAATDAYELLPSPELAQLIATMIEKFCRYDVVKAQAQTHATLTICRGVLRHARHTGDAMLVSAVAEIWKSYRNLAMTENYENWVWFGRPEWTEGCGVVDSFEVAMELWRLTGEDAYLADAQLIWHNGITFNQWRDGGFGACDCAGAKGSPVAGRQFAAPWCCTMRGAEGFFYVRNAVLTMEDSTLTWLTLISHTAAFQADGQPGRLRVETEFPTGRKITLILEQGSLPAVTLRFFLPAEWLAGEVTATRAARVLAVQRQGDFIVIHAGLNVGDRVDLDVPMNIRAAEAVTVGMRPAWHRFMHGPLVLSEVGTHATVLPRGTSFAPLSNGRYQAVGTNVVLGPLSDTAHPDTAPEQRDKRVVLFREVP